MKAIICLAILAITFASINADPAKKCAKWACANKKDAPCGHSELADKAEQATVTYNKSCKDTEYCDVFGNSLINTEKTHDYKCVAIEAEKDIPIVAGSRYPGEACVNKEDCAQIDGAANECTANKCAGAVVTEGEKVTDPLKCGHGFYAKADTELDSNLFICTKFIAKDQPCVNSFDCENGYGCHALKCIALGSVPAGTAVVLGNDVPELDVRDFCATGKAEGTTCKDWADYTEEQKKKTADKNGFYECQFEEKMKFTDNIEVTCICGMNADGKGYFPKSEVARKLIILIFS